MNQKDTLEQLFHHRQQADQLERALLDDAEAARASKERLLELLSEVASESTDETDPVQLIVVAGLLAQLGGQGSARQLIDLLGDADEAVRGAAGAGLVEVAIEEFPIVAAEIRDALDREEAPVLAEELAFLLTELGDEGTSELLLAMLDHEEAPVVVSALQVAGEWGWDQQVFERLESLESDKRSVELHDEEEGLVTLTLGELASEITEALRDVGGGGGR